MTLTTKLVFVSFLVVIGLSGWAGKQFYRGYEDGYGCAQDTFQNPDDRTGGFYDYWLNGGFWFQQGYEEGYKRGARDYVKENGVKE
jgi:hypothetical protein